MVLGLLLMSQTKQCSKCQLIKSLSEFNKDPRKSLGVNGTCKSCYSKYILDHKQATKQMLKQIRLDAGGCQDPNCQSSPDHTRLLCHEDNIGLFDLDHINEHLKLHSEECRHGWITGNWQEFMSRVKPNLQVLCTHCHRARSGESSRLGNSVYSKKHGRKPPAQFVDPEHTLFNPPQTSLLFEDEDIQVLPDRIKREDDWFVTRDGHGHLLSYRDALEGETFGYLYDADGEEIT